MQQHEEDRISFFRVLFTACGLIFLLTVAEDSGDVGASYLFSKDSNPEMQTTAQQRAL